MVLNANRKSRGLCILLDVRVLSNSVQNNLYVLIIKLKDYSFWIFLRNKLVCPYRIFNYPHDNPFTDFALSYFSVKTNTKHIRALFTRVRLVLLKKMVLIKGIGLGLRREL